MVSFITVLCSDVWNVVCDVLKYGVLANVERSEMGLYEKSRLLFLFDFGMDMM